MKQIVKSTLNRIFQFYLWLILYLTGRLVNARLMSKAIGKQSLTQIGSAEAVKFAAVNQLTPPNFNKTIEAEHIEPGHLRWFSEIKDRKRSDPVLLFFHGGGYALGCRQPHADFLSEIYRNLPTCHRLSIVWLDYTLSLTAPFPKQVIEAASAYNALLKSTDNILLLGDSAGANLAINLMRHIQQPFKGVPIVEPETKPSAVILLSPWLILNVDESTLDPESSFIKYRFSDTLSIASNNSFGKLVLNDYKNEELNKLFASTYNDTTIPWNKVLPPAHKTFVSYGENEVLRDSIETFLDVSKLTVRGATIVVEPKGMHMSMAFPGEYPAVLPSVLHFLKSTLPTQTPPPDF